MTWTTAELSKIIAADDLHISPFREDGVTYGTPTWIWCVPSVSSGRVRARAPRLYGQIQRDSLRYIDLNNDGTKEIVFATNLGMYRTR